jgi:tRNA pseudouridine38-40 synthase
LTISYDGTDFAGSQRQPGVRTVQAVVEAALAGLFGRAEPTTFAGRTDRGVHAAGQVVGCADRRADLTERVLRDALNARLPADVGVLEVERRGADFHARYDARWRAYRYRVWTGGPAPLARRYVWRQGGSLDPEAMDEAAGRLVGRRDFASFAGGGEGVPWSERRRRPRGTERTLFGCRCVEIPAWWTGGEGASGRVVEVRVVADGFLPQMVRNLAGALVEVGRGAKGPAWLDEVLAAKDRRIGVATAPAHGLTFWRVGYDGEAPDL